MSEINLELSSTNDVLIVLRETGDAASAELASLLLSHEATPSVNGYSISPYVLRIIATELGKITARYNISRRYDGATRRILEQHRDEVDQRKQAIQNLDGLSADIVEQSVFASHRFQRRLTSMQLRDVGRLLTLKHGANFSVPGAGKTTSLLACYEVLRSRSDIEHLLVIAPKNAFLSWEAEVEVCYPDPRLRPRIQRITGGVSRAIAALAEEPEIALITYQFLPNVLPHIKTWINRNATHVVLDESHRAKSGAGVYARAALELSTAARRRDILSGTPIPNSPEDLRAQMEFLWPGQRILPDSRLRTDSGESTIQEVQKAVAPLYVRTTKSELNLPPLRPVPVQVELGPLQRELYELLRSEARRISHRVPPGDMRLLRKLGQHVMVMLEVASNPMLLASLDSLADLEGSGSSSAAVWELLRECARSEQPAKIAKTLELVDTALSHDPRHKVLIWTSFVQNVLLLERLLARFQPVTLYGAIATGSDEDFDTREGRIRRFHEDPQCRVMIANPAACGEGISLHRACNHAIYLDRTFNAAHYLQSIDRIHRLGLRSDTPTRVEILEARWTIDSRVAKRLKTKIDSMSVILNDSGLSALAYDPLDVVEEFPAGIQAEDVEDIIDHIANGEPEGT